MSHPRSGSLVVWSCAAAIWFAVSGIAQAVPTVWSGLTFEFSKDGNAFPFPADAITSKVALTRGSTQGLYNAEIDAGWNGSGPSDTRWATNITNPTQTIVATNHAALTFSSWLSAYGGSMGVGHNIVGRDAVLHLISDDIYLDITFTAWSTGIGGFTYLRAEAPAAPTPTGDYNGNGVVDAADYVLWRDTLDQTVVTPGSGADGNGNGMIDDDDYQFWRARFGNVIAAPGQGAGTIAAVPEPASAALLLIGLIGFQWCSARRLHCARHLS